MFILNKVAYCGWAKSSNVLITFSIDSLAFVASPKIVDVPVFAVCELKASDVVVVEPPPKAIPILPSSDLAIIAIAAILGIAVYGSPVPAVKIALVASTKAKAVWAAWKVAASLEPSSNIEDKAPAKFA